MSQKSRIERKPHPHHRKETTEPCIHEEKAEES